MRSILNILKWMLIIAFFPLSLVVVGYYKQKEAKKSYWDKDEEVESTVVK